MSIIASDNAIDLASFLNAYDCPAILVTRDYELLATNQHYRDAFGDIEPEKTTYCYQVSHGYSVPCDQAGEDCPLLEANSSGQKARVLHIHQTPRGKEHVDVEILPIHNDAGQLQFFIELLKPLTLSSPEISDHDMVGASSAFNKLIDNINRVAASEASVLLLGESGTGKELAAQAIHRASPRHDKPIVTLECAGLTETLFESELFGHVKGAFTGATYTKKGLVADANGGTLFLDEIADVPMALQVKLLRLIETGVYRPVGSSETHRADFRLICATHKNLLSMVLEGAFRQDLYYRINVFPIHLPSLHERRDDIALLAKSILKRLDHRGKAVLTDSAVTVLKTHQYRGHIRELRNILTRALVLANTSVIDQHVIKQCLAIDQQVVGDRVESEDKAVESLAANEKRYLSELLARVGGDKEAAAEVAGISVRALYRRLARGEG